MSTGRTIICLMTAVLLTGCGGVSKQNDAELVDYISECRQTLTPIVPPSKTTHPELTISEAYKIQSAVGEKMSAVLGKPVGYKLAFASKASQQANGISEPIYGILYSKQLVQSGGTIKLSGYNDLRIEAEVTVKFGKSVDKRIASVDELKKYIESIHIGFDINNVRFDKKAGKPTPADIIVSGTGIKNFAVGPPVGEEINIDSLDIEQKHNGERVYGGNSSAVMGSPWSAALWLVQKLHDNGGKINAGDYILTGAVAKAYGKPAAPDSIKGVHTGSADLLGTVQVTLE